MNDIVKKESTDVAITPTQMLAIAVEQGADLDKLEKLMDLQERWEDKQAHKNYIASMSRFRSECPVIERTKSGHNIKYAGLAESLEQIKDLLAECGLSHSWSTVQDGSVTSVTCTVTHVDGHSESTSLSAAPDTSGSKNAIQAIGSTVSYLQRYTLFAILGIASADADTDGNFETPPDAIDAIMGATTLDELQTVFKKQWAKYPKARKELTGAKDIKKKEFV